MKYSQFLKLSEALENNGITIEEFKKDPALYEGILGKAATALLNVAKKGMKAAISKGIQPGFQKKLDASAVKIKDWVVAELEKGQKDQNHELYQFFEAKKGKKPQQQRLIDKEIVRYIDKNVKTQSKKVTRSIDKKEALRDEERETLHDYWEELEHKLELSIANEYRKSGILSDDGMELLAQALYGDTKIGAQQQKQKQQPVKKQPEQPTQTKTEQPEQQKQ